MSTRLSETIALLHDTRIVDLESAGIDAEDAAALADALKETTSVKKSTAVTMKSGSRVHWRSPTC
jgi:hypothetical protein